MEQNILFLFYFPVDSLRLLWGARGRGRQIHPDNHTRFLGWALGQYVLLILSLLCPSHPPHLLHCYVCPSPCPVPRPGFLPASSPALLEASLPCGLRDLPTHPITLGGSLCLLDGNSSPPLIWFLPPAPFVLSTLLLYLPLSGSLFKKNLLLPPIGFQCVISIYFCISVGTRLHGVLPQRFLAGFMASALIDLRTFEGSLPSAQNQPSQQMLRKNCPTSCSLEKQI